MKMKKWVSFILVISVIMSYCGNMVAFAATAQAVVIEAKYDKLAPLVNMEGDDTVARTPLFSFEEKGKYGIVNTDGKVIAEAVYDKIGEYKNGFIAVYKQDKLGYIDNTGKVITDTKYDTSYGFHEGLADVSINGKHGFIDATGKEVVPLQYEDALFFSDDLAPVCTNGLWGLINKSGATVLEPKYAMIGCIDQENNFAEGFVNGIVQVEDTNGKWGYIDTTGKEIIAPQFDRADDFYFENYALIYSGNMVGIATPEGVALKPTYDNIDLFILGEKGLAAFVQDGKQGLINKKMKVVVKAEYDSIGRISPDGYFNVAKNGKWGAVDTSGKIIIKPQYEFLGGFCNGLAPVIVKGKVGYVNTKNKLVIAATYKNDGSYDFDFAFNRAIVNKNGKYGVIDTKGKYVTKPQYQQIIRDSENELFIVKKDNKYGVLNKDGKVILKASFHSINMAAGILLATKDTTTTLYSTDGKKLVLTNFENMAYAANLSNSDVAFTYEKDGKTGAVICKVK